LPSSGSSTRSGVLTPTNRSDERVFLGRVIGELVSTVKHTSLLGRKLLVVERLSETLEPLDDSILAVDAVDAGRGDTVLVVDEGGSAALVTGLDNPPIRTVIVGVIDRVDLEEAAP
jgi:microcompartment protein CcmK/EutM